MDKEIVSVLVPVIVLILLQWAMIRSIVELSSTSHYGIRKNVWTIIAACFICPVIGIIGFLYIGWWLLPLGVALPGIFLLFAVYLTLEEWWSFIKYARSEEDL